MNVVETITRRNITIQLIQDADGYWGWRVGNYTMYPTFRQRDICIQSAVRHITQIQDAFAALPR